MSSRRNFLDADNSIMERNLRFVKNDLEENLNQYFGGSTSRGNNSTNNIAPPRDYKVVQPKPGVSRARAQSNGLENRKGFLLQLGLARHEAYELAKNSEFDVSRLEQKYREYAGSGFRQDDVCSRILNYIRNQDNWNENITHQDQNISTQSPPVPLISKFHEEEVNLNLRHREYKGHGNRSRSRSYSLSRNDQRQNRYQPERYISPNRGLISCQRRERRSHSRPYSPTTVDRREERIRSSRSRSPNRVLSLMQERRGVGYFFQHDRGEIGRNTSRSRSYSPPVINSKGDYYHSRSRSPNGGLNERKVDRYMHAINIDEERRDVTREQSRQRPYSPPRNVDRYMHDINIDEERRDITRTQSLQRPYSPPRRVDRYMYNIDVDEERGDITREQSRQRPYSPPRNVCINKEFSPSRSCSPYRELRLESGEMFLQHDNFRDVSGRESLRDLSRYHSPSKFDRRQNHDRMSRSSSPAGCFIERKLKEQHEDFKNTVYEERRFRAYSPFENYRKNEVYRSSRSRSPNWNFNSINEKRRQDTNYNNNSRGTSTIINVEPSSAPAQKYANNSKFISKQQNQSMQKQNIPSLLSIDLFSNQAQNYEISSQNRNIPSLLSLNVFPEQNDFHQSSKANNSNLHNQKSYKKRTQRDNRNETNVETSKKTQQIQWSLEQGQNIFIPPIIQSGLLKPSPGHLKANPRDYWSKWWPQYKYIENTIPKINPNDYEVKKCIKFLHQPNTEAYNKRRHMLLSRGIKEIMKTIDIDETNYWTRPIVKLFEFKNHLEDPNFQNSLKAQQLNHIAPALRQFKIRPTMALLHQSLIVKWHSLLDTIKQEKPGMQILSTNARILINKKSMHYLVMESIQELKKMCQQDWPQFNEFYKNIKVKK